MIPGRAAFLSLVTEIRTNRLADSRFWKEGCPRAAPESTQRPTPVPGAMLDRVETRRDASGVLRRFDRAAAFAP